LHTTQRAVDIPQFCGGPLDQQIFEYLFLTAAAKIECFRQLELLTLQNLQFLDSSRQGEPSFMPRASEGGKFEATGQSLIEERSFF